MVEKEENRIFKKYTIEEIAVCSFYWLFKNIIPLNNKEYITWLLGFLVGIYFGKLIGFANN